MLQKKKIFQKNEVMKCAKNEKYAQIAERQQIATSPSVRKKKNALLMAN